MTGLLHETQVKPHVELLKETRERIEQGWCQCHYAMEVRSTGQMRFCVMGALSMTTDREAAVKAVKAITATIGDRTIIDWNDHPGRTKDEVLDMLDTTIRRETHGSAGVDPARGRDSGATGDVVPVVEPPVLAPLA